MILDPAFETQLARCRLALRQIDVPESFIQAVSWSPPLLQQFSHMAVFLEVPWRDAFRWVHDNRWTILEYAKQGKFDGFLDKDRGVDDGSNALKKEDGFVGGDKITAAADRGDQGADVLSLGSDSKRPASLG